MLRSRKKDRKENERKVGRNKPIGGFSVVEDDKEGVRRS